MPYRTLTELPSSVKGVLPHPAQTAQKIYLAAFNHAWKQYQNPEKGALQMIKKLPHIK